MTVELGLFWPRLLVRAAIWVGLGLSGGACSMSFPLPGIANDDGPT